MLLLSVPSLKCIPPGEKLCPIGHLVCSSFDKYYIEFVRRIKNLKLPRKFE